MWNKNIFVNIDNDQKNLNQSLKYLQISSKWVNPAYWILNGIIHRSYNFLEIIALNNRVIDFKFD